MLRLSDNLLATDGELIWRIKKISQINPHASVALKFLHSRFFCECLVQMTRERTNGALHFVYGHSVVFRIVLMFPDIKGNVKPVDFPNRRSSLL